jgi:restriction system protein
MTEPSRLRSGELARAVFTVLLDQPDGLLAGAVLTRVVELVPPGGIELEPYPSRPQTRRYENVVRFATIGPVKAGWLVKQRGLWSLTAEGRDAYAAFPDPVTFQREAARLYRVWKKAQLGSAETAAGDTDDDFGEPAVGTRAFEEAEEAAWEEIRGYLRQIPPYEFQDLFAGLLRAIGYHVLWVAPPGPDRGIDLVAHTDPLGMTSPRIKVQVKRQIDTKTTVEGLRAFLAVLGEQDVGIFVSAGGFTSEATREARSQEKRRLTLIDLDRLIELWIEHFPELSDADRRRMPLKPIHFLAPAD